MEELKKFEKIAENLAVSFKLATTAAAVFGDDMQKVREVQMKADPSYLPSVNFKWTYSGMKEWFRYKKMSFDQAVNDLKLEALVKETNKNKKVDG